MRTEMERVSPPAVMVDNEAKLLVGTLVCPFPGFSQETSLIVCRQCFRLTDINFRRLKLQRYTNHAVEHILCRHYEKAHGMGIALRKRDDLREEISLVTSRGCVCLTYIVNIDTQQADGHSHHIPVSCDFHCGDNVRQWIRVSDRNQDVTGTRLDMAERDIT